MTRLRVLRSLIEIMFPTSPRVKFIVPVTVELVAMQRQGFHFRLRRRHSFRILPCVELSSDPKPCIGARIAYQVDYGFEVRSGLPRQFCVM